MCGIAGAAWTSEAAAVTRPQLERMVSVLAHRGPDACGHHLVAESGIALGHRRLSIIDVAGSAQPLSNEDETVWVSFNGEIYNYVELRRELIDKGHTFETEGDTEVLVHLYEEHGTGLVDRLRGMFAFAIWDATRQRLLLVRDRLGQKPLFYRHADDRLVFASELKSLLQLPNAPREIDPEAIDLYLTYQYVPYPKCILAGYAKLPPAHLAVYEKGRLDLHRYWTPPFEDGTEHVPESLADSHTWPADRWRSELRERLTEAVRLRLRSDVPLGAFLSGGVDSTIVAGLMQEVSETRVHTFSIGFPVATYDERSYAREAAATLGTEHHEQVVEPSALDVLPRLVWHYDEPFADSSAIPTMALSKMTRKHVTVALSGDGGDELFAGYHRYRAVRTASYFDHLPGPARALLGWSQWQRIPAPVERRSVLRRGKRFLKAVNRPPHDRYLQWISIFDDEHRERLYADDFRARLGEHDPVAFLEAGYAKAAGRDTVTQTTCADVLTYLPCDILTKVDVASMAYGLECRSPFMDHHVAELAARMPIGLKYRWNRGKRILLETFADLLPVSIRNRPKMGFGVPLDHWFRGSLRRFLERTLLDRRCLDRGYFRESEIRRLIDEHTRERWDHGARLWSLVVLETWFRTWIDGDVPTGPPA